MNNYQICYLSYLDRTIFIRHTQRLRRIDGRSLEYGELGNTISLAPSFDGVPAEFIAMITPSTI
ncbi:MAG: hypothetical protein ACI9GW_002788 [Halieaceae bacterium]